MLPADVTGQLRETIEVKEQRIMSWARFAGGIGDEDRALANAVSAASAGLEPLKKIAAIPEVQQVQVLETLRKQGHTLDRLFDVVLFDDCAAAATRVKLRREQERLKASWSVVWSKAELTNALGEHVAASEVVAGKHVALLMAASWREECIAFVSTLMDFHAEVVRKQGAPLQIVLVSFDHSEPEMVRWMRAPIKKDKRLMPWLAAPFGSELHTALSERYNSLLRGLPTLILLSADGAVVSNRAHADVVLHSVGAWEGWRVKLASAPTQPTGAPSILARPGAFDVFDDAAAVMKALFNEVAVGRTGSAQRHALVHIGTDWSDGSARLDAMLASAEVAAALEARFVLRHLCYETCQRWLMYNARALHHCALPTLAAFTATGKLIAEADLDSLLQDDGGRAGAGVLAFLAQATVAADEEAPPPPQPGTHASAPPPSAPPKSTSTSTSPHPDKGGLPVAAGNASATFAAALANAAARAPVTSTATITSTAALTTMQGQGDSGAE